MQTCDHIRDLEITVTEICLSIKGRTKSLSRKVYIQQAEYEKKKEVKEMWKNTFMLVVGVG